ncbi:MAG: tRNA 2-thiouridine(34) synthase MnmA [Gammaproteobacteria bacterium]
MNPHPRVIVGMSGGVDSSIAALLLKQQGYRVEGLFMKNWEADDNNLYCSGMQDLTDARAVCDRLEIPLHTANFSQTYWDKVFRYFLDEYAAGRTPNPDILCNKEIKFKAFLDHALHQGADYIATGHYVRCLLQENNHLLYKSMDSNKDQSYFLHTLTQQQLSYCLFPLGELQKPQVRTLATEAGFINHAKKDSTGICFIGKRNFKQFLQEYLLTRPGDIETTEGEIIGKHDGLMYYTLGQRKGLKIGGKKHKLEAPWYVAAKDISRNVLMITQQRDHPLLLTSELICDQVNWIASPLPITSLRCTAKIRYRQADQLCTMTAMTERRYRVIFDKPQWAITPGQSVVFYQGDLCLGGGIIQVASY